jgi:hypothetical protein
VALLVHRPGGLKKKAKALWRTGLEFLWLSSGPKPSYTIAYLRHKLEQLSKKRRPDKHQGRTGNLKTI